MNSVASHPRLQELLQMRETILAKDANSPQRQVQAGGSRELDGYGGTDKMTYDSASYEKNYNYDFHLTKQDINKLYNGKFDDDLLTKLEADLGTLDNHPNYAPQGNKTEIDYTQHQDPKYKQDNEPMSDSDWDEANALFSKGVDNLAVGTYAGIEQDENGNITFDPEKFVLGLGGYTAVKMALKNDKVRGELKDRLQYALERVDFNPEVQKANGINSMSPVKIGKNNDTTIDEVENILNNSFKPYKHIEATNEAWIKEFNLKSINDTAEVKNVFGETVKITPNQIQKMMDKSRGHYMGLVKSTIQEPTIVLKHKDAEVYITRFYDENKKQYNLFAVNKDYNTGELTLSSVVHRRTSQIRNKILEGEVTYINHGTVDGVSSSRVTPSSSNTNSHETIIPQTSKNIQANGQQSLAGGFAGGSDSLINQRDYDGDGEYSYKDLLAGVASGAIGVNALKKLAPKLFDEGAESGFKAFSFHLSRGGTHT